MADKDKEIESLKEAIKFWEVNVEAAKLKGPEEFKEAKRKLLGLQGRLNKAIKKGEEGWMRKGWLARRKLKKEGGEEWGEYKKGKEKYTEEKRAMRPERGRAFFGFGGEGPRKASDVLLSPGFIMSFYMAAFFLIIIIPIIIAGLFFLAIALFLSFRSGNQTYTVMAGAVIGAIITRGYLSGFIPLYGFDRLIGLFMAVGSASFMQLITKYDEDAPYEKLMVGGFGVVIVITTLIFITMIETFYLIIWLISILLFWTALVMNYPEKHPLGTKVSKMIPLICLVGAGIFYGLAYAFTIGGVMFGGVIDTIMHSLGGTSSSGGSIFDMILNPKLALAAQLKPPTEREYAPGATAPPNIAFTTSFQAIPLTGCYEHSIYTIIGKIKNTGTAFIDDIRLTIKTEEGISNPSVCQSGEVKDSLKKPDGVEGCIWHQGIQIAPGSTVSKSCLAGPVNVPTGLEELVNWFGDMICLPNCDFAYQGGEDVLPSHRCFFDVIASTAFHSRSRLPIEIIDNSYAKNKYLQGTLISSIRPSTSSVGPVEFSLGGIEQPVWDNNDAVTMIVSTVNTGNGEVNEYSSIYLLIPKNLLDEEDGKPTCNNDDWVCFDYEGPVYEYSDGGGTWKDNAEALKQFAEGEGVGSIENFKLTYDSSLDNEVLKSDYAICFYNKGISGGSLMQTATCNLKMRPNPEGTLRRTEIIRGDVLYTYKVTSDASFEVRDCTI